MILVILEAKRRGSIIFHHFPSVMEFYIFVLNRGCSGLPKFLLLAAILPLGSFERMRSQELKCSQARI